jgi:hypothetical protein
MWQLIAWNHRRTKEPEKDTIAPSSAVDPERK